MTEETPAEAAERTARIVARRALPELTYLFQVSAWRLRFSGDEIRAAYLLLEALNREVDSVRRTMSLSEWERSYRS